MSVLAGGDSHNNGRHSDNNRDNGYQGEQRHHEGNNQDGYRDGPTWEEQLDRAYSEGIRDGEENNRPERYRNLDLQEAYDAGLNEGRRRHDERDRGGYRDDSWDYRPQDSQDGYHRDNGHNGGGGYRSNSRDERDRGGYRDDGQRRRTPKGSGGYRRA